MILDYLNVTYIPWPDLLLRCFLALLFGFVLGLDRERKNKPIDFRAYMIVSLVSCIIAVLSQELYFEFAQIAEGAKIDLGKVIAGTLTGIGFLGAGAIIKREDDEVVGTTTGASVWAAGGVGLALGYGYYGLALVAFVSIALILIIGGLFKSKISK